MNKYKKKFGEWIYSNGDRNSIIDKIGLITVVTLMLAFLLLLLLN
jgi:hypothetical protein